MTTRAHSAIIDIGSNSIRLVIYNGPKRAPSIMFNEKVLAGLGTGLAETGALSSSAMKRALAALRRYKMLTDEADVGCLRVVATAAVREASNANGFLAKISALGLRTEVLSGEAEARAAGYGVISAFPDADGIVGDLGGGSLELIRVRKGKVHARTSLPLGVLRLKTLRRDGDERFVKLVHDLLHASGWSDVEKGLPFYMVGGSWRTLARFHMHMTDYPLAVLHNYAFAVEDCAHIRQALLEAGPQRTKAMAGLSNARVPTLGDATALLETVTQVLGSANLIVSAHGLREGLLFEALPEVEQSKDPLIEAVRAEGRLQGRFAEHGDLLTDWMAQLFAGETIEESRLRHAACLLSDVSWRAHPDFRAERGMDIALHGNWVGVDGRGRAMLAQALFTSFGGSPSPHPLLTRLAAPQEIDLAIKWGLAIRLGQRLSGGLAAPLLRTSLEMTDTAVGLRMPEEAQALTGEVIERRHKQLAAAFGRDMCIMVPALLT